MLFKDISSFKLWWPFCSAEWNHLCYYGRGHYGEQSSEMILYLDQRFKRCHFNFIFSIGVHFVQLQSGTICAILVEGIYVQIF